MAVRFRPPLVKTSSSWTDKGNMTTPTVFVSYAHEEPDHDQWVTELASNLRYNAVDASLDAWDLVPGQDTTYFMESQIRNSDFVTNYRPTIA
jgi:TIR domain